MFEQTTPVDGDEVVYNNRVDTQCMLTTGFDPGTRLPAHTSTAGRMLLAALPCEARHACLERVTLVAYTHQTVTDKQVPLRELLAIREQGYAVMQNQYERGLRGMSVPNKTRHGNLVGAISVSMLISTCSKVEATAQCVPALQATAPTVMLWV